MNYLYLKELSSLMSKRICQFISKLTANFISKLTVRNRVVCIVEVFVSICLNVNVLSRLLRACKCLQGMSLPYLEVLTIFGSCPDQ